MAEKKNVVKVRFTEQQLLLLDDLRKQGAHGNTFEEMTANLLRDYCRQMLGREAK